ncbi:BRCT domain-containing protein [Marinilactibacillus psychrotolerans]|uniref:BRCT domain-containing protein n=1 Tax=Marinilactibacillus psychrotolerans TaxID=191770 RepID=A0A5R9BZ14_9LACT|nr:BRCT domain-containing protein [Marinilactibacillus psychrotolerans]TLQ05221.1 hypothetical protein FEZ48_12680 [Marinilactibacillus psychrotolerans]
MIKHNKIVFTGKLDSMSRKQAHALVIALGGEVQDFVSKTTTLLVVGKKNIDLFEEDSRSIKIKKAEELNSIGHNIHRISEKEFYNIAILTLMKSNKIDSTKKLLIIKPFSRVFLRVMTIYGFNYIPFY